MSKKKPVKIEIEVRFVPFPSEEKRVEAYRTHARLFLRAKERIVREILKNKDRGTEGICR